MFNFGPKMFGLDVIVIPVPTIKVQARCHPRKKRRLQKKWLKRYGYKTIVDPKADLDSVLVDKRHNRVYCYPQQEAKIRAAFRERSSNYY
jgi:hypothetical protein